MLPYGGGALGHQQPEILRYRYIAAAIYGGTPRLFAGTATAAESSPKDLEAHLNLNACLAYQSCPLLFLEYEGSRGLAALSQSLFT